MINSNCEGDLLLSFRSVAVRCGAVLCGAVLCVSLRFDSCFVFEERGKERKVR